MCSSIEVLLYALYIYVLSYIMHKNYASIKYIGCSYYYYYFINHCYAGFYSMDDHHWSKSVSWTLSLTAIYVLYNLLWEYKQGHYHSVIPLLLVYCEPQLLYAYALLISSRFGHGGATSSQLRLVVIPSWPIWMIKF